MFNTKSGTSYLLSII